MPLFHRLHRGQWALIGPAWWPVCEVRRQVVVVVAPEDSVPPLSGITFGRHAIDLGFVRRLDCFN